MHTLDMKNTKITYAFADDKEIHRFENRFIKFLKKNWKFTTVEGAVNIVKSITKDTISIQTKVSEKGFDISRDKLKAAIKYFFEKRTIARKDLEKFSNFNSALFGILNKAFESIAYLKKTKGRVFRLSLIGVRFFASGLERDPTIRKVVRELGGKFLLLNYYYIRNNKNWLKMIEDEDFYVLIDSGAFTIYKKTLERQRDERESDCYQSELFTYDELPMITLDEWSNFIEENKNNPRIVGFFNLDVIEDPQQTRENFKELKRRLPNTNIYPVWQFTDSLDELEKLVNSEEEYDLIGIGGMVPFLSKRQHIVREKLDVIFKKFPQANFHFLGGANEMLIDYPFFASDSSAYLNARKSEDQRQVYLPNGVRVEAPKEMSTLEIITQNLAFLFGLEKLYEGKQSSLFEYVPAS